MTQKVINIIQGSPQCMDSVRSVPCNDYEARFGAFIRVKYGIITLSSIDWPKVAQAMESQL